MPAPEDLQIHSPGDPTANTSPLADAVTQATQGNPLASETQTAAAQSHAPVFIAKHRSGGVWYVLDANGERVGDFQGDKLEVQAEIDRLTVGGAPYVKPVEQARAREESPVIARTPAPREGVDPTTLRQAVFTPDGWLCPEPAAGKE